MKNSRFAKYLKKYKNSICPIKYYMDEKGDFYIEFKEKDIKQLFDKYKIYANI